MIDVTYIIYATVFVAVLLIIEGLGLLLTRGGRNRKGFRQRLLPLTADGAIDAERLRRKSGNSADRASRASLLHRLETLARQAGIAAAPQAILGIMVGAGAAVTVALVLLHPMDPVMTVAIGAACGIALPVIALAVKRRRRFRRFGQQLPDALDIMVRSLRAGHPIPTAMRTIGEQMEEPMRGEIGIVVDEMTYGLDLREAMDRLSERMPQPELRFVVVAITIQYRTGGNLSEILGNLSKVMRARATMMQKAKAITAEGRMSFIVLLVMPFLMVGIMNLINPEYYGPVWKDPILHMGFALAGALLAIGSIVIWRMVSFRI
jgi:tight adherence protein B